MRTKFMIYILLISVVSLALGAHTSAETNQIVRSMLWSRMVRVNVDRETSVIKTFPEVKTEQSVFSHPLRVGAQQKSAARLSGTSDICLRQGQMG